MRLSSTRTVLKSRLWVGTRISKAHWSSLSEFVAVRNEPFPLRVEDEVEELGMGPEDECTHEMFVLTPWRPRALAVPLMQLEDIQGEDATREAVEDWHYWVDLGYELLEQCQLFIAAFLGVVDVVSTGISETVSIEGASAP